MLSSNLTISDTNIRSRLQGVDLLLSFILLAFFIFTVSGRPFDHNNDTQVYVNVYRNLGNFGFLDVVDYFRIEYGFLLFSKIINFIGFDERGYLILIAITQACLWFFCFRINVSNEQIIPALLFFISFFCGL
jgi:hypothetical protein